MIFDGDRDAMGQYIRDLADQMGLRDWHLVFSSQDPANPEACGECLVTYGQKHAAIRLRNWENEDPDELRNTVVHELVHCHQEFMRWSINNFKHAVGGDVYNVIYDAFSDALELATDGIATAWAEALPLPIKEETPDEEAA